MLEQIYPFVLEPLPYDYNALEPYIDADTMYFHHDKHLGTYIERLNAALKEYPEYQKLNLVELLLSIPEMPEKLQKDIQNNGGGVFNHTIYFEQFSPNLNQSPTGELEKDLIEKYGDLETFYQEMTKAGMGVFGSGWAWLVKNVNNELEIMTTKNQNTVIQEGMIPLLALDVWEHAYYLKHQNRRNDYISDWFYTIDWDKVNKWYMSR